MDLTYCTSNVYWLSTEHNDTKLPQKILLNHGHGPKSHSGMLRSCLSACICTHLTATSQWPTRWFGSPEWPLWAYLFNMYLKKKCYDFSTCVHLFFQLPKLAVHSLIKWYAKREPAKKKLRAYWASPAHQLPGPAWIWSPSWRWCRQVDTNCSRFLNFAYVRSLLS